MQLNRPFLSCFFAILLIKLVIFGGQINAQEKLDNKAQLTAAFIYQITKFTAWPESLFEQNAAAFPICVLGSTDDVLLSHLLKLESKSTQGRQIKVVQLNDTKQLIKRSANNCKVLYAADDQWQDLTAQEVEQLSASTLLIGSSKEFLQQGGMLALIVINNKMKIFINTTNLESTPIRLESRLKALAKAF